MRDDRARARACALFALCLFLLCAFPARAEEIKFVAPTLPSGAEKYDADHPDNLIGDMLYGKSAILIEETTGEVIFEKNADDLMYPASTTKVMTLILGIELGDMNAVVTARDYSYELPSDASLIPIQAGEEINFRDLLFATAIRSGNEGAILIAETIAGSVPAFADLMNQKAMEIGCVSTHFVNPHGLHDPAQYTTARDLSLIAQYAMRNETFREMARTISYPLPKSNLSRSRKLTNPNDFYLNPDREDNTAYYYSYGTGIKTGFTNAAGYCFVGGATKQGVSLISVVLYSRSMARFTDTKKLMEYGFSQFISVSPVELYGMNPITVETSGFSRSDTNLGRLPLYLQAGPETRPVNIVGTKDKIDTMARNLRSLVLVEYTRDFQAPIQAGEVVGTMTYIPEGGGAVSVYNLVASRTVERREDAPKSLEEIVAETYADPNPFPPFSIELLGMALLPVGGIALLVWVILKLTHRTGRRKKLRAPKPANRFYQ